MPQNIPTIPLRPGSDIQVNYPPLRYFMDKIDNRDYFHFTKQLHGIWDAIYGALRWNKKLRGIRGLRRHKRNDNYIRHLARHMVEFKNKKSPWKYCTNIYVDVLKMMIDINQRPSDFLFGISDTSFNQREEPRCNIKEGVTVRGRARFRKGMFTVGCRQAAMKALLPRDHILFDGSCWKEYGWYHEIDGFFNKYKKEKIVIIGPSYFSDFDQRLGLLNFEHIPIDYYKASNKAFETRDFIFHKHEQLKQENEFVIYFITAGTFGAWLTSKLHGYRDGTEKLERAFVIDCGRMLDVFYLEIAKKMRWVWLRKYKRFMKRYMFSKAWGEYHDRELVPTLERYRRYKIKLDFGP